MAVIFGQKDSPTLDLNFSRNKSLVDTLTGRNLITFSRDSIGSYTDANGVIQSAASGKPRFDHDPSTGESLGLLVEEASTNYAVKPFFNFTPDTTNSTLIPNYALAPDGTFTAALLNGGMEVTNVAVIDKRLFSIFIKKVSSDVFTAYLAQSGGDSTLSFTFSTETISNPQGSIINMGYRKYPNGWYRIYGQVATTSGSANWRPVLYSNPGNPTNGQTCLVWGHQDEVGSFPTSYIPTPATFTSRSTTATYYDANGVIQTAGVNVGRDDAYLPDENGVMRPAGLLLEAASTNSYTYSNDLTQTVYSKNNVTLSVNSAVAPDGTNTATKVIPTTDLTTHSISRLGTLGLSSMRSVYVKAAGYTSCTVYDINTGAKATINLITGAITNAGYFNFDIYFRARGRIRNVGNGWWRIEVGYDSYSSTNNPFHVYPNNDSTFAGDGTSGILVWGYQQEADVYPYPTSYIPTSGSTVTRAADVSTSSTVTRSADVAQITGSNFSSWYNQSEGTVFADWSTGDPDRVNMFALSDGTTNNRISAYSNKNSNILVSYIASPAGGYDQSASSAALTASKYTVGYIAGDTQPAYNSVLGSAITEINLPVNNKLIIGADETGGNLLNGHLSRLTYYPTRLSNALLQKLTK